MQDFMWARAIGNRTWQTAKLLAYLPCEIDLVNTKIRLSGGSTTASEVA
jgi:hypothetical protein